MTAAWKNSTNGDLKFDFVHSPLSSRWIQQHSKSLKNLQSNRNQGLMLLNLSNQKCTEKDTCCLVTFKIWWILTYLSNLYFRVAQSPKKSKPADVYAFLGEFSGGDWIFEEELKPWIDVDQDVEYFDLPAYTTPFTTPAYTPPFTTPSYTTRPTTTTTTTTPTTTTAMPSRPRRLAEYCTGRRGQFSYGPDCHSFVDCWDGQAFLKVGQAAAQQTNQGFCPV